MAHDHGTDSCSMDSCSMDSCSTEGCSCGCGCDSGPVIDKAEAARWRQAPDDQMICACAGVDKAAVLAAIEAGAFTAPLVKTMTGVGRNLDCRERRQCQADLEALVALYATPPC